MSTTQSALMTGRAGPDQTRWSSSAHSKPKPGREINEDAFLADSAAGLFVVADGMGGHADGGVASRSIIKIMHHLVDCDGSIDERVSQVEDAVRRSNKALLEEGRQRGRDVIIGSTVAALVVGQAHAAVLWAGDSRIYLLRDERLYQLTKDHSTIVATGNNRSRSLLTNAVGSSEVMQLERVVMKVSVGDCFLVCSDGLTKVFDPSEIADYLREAAPDAAEQLVERAFERRSRDDVTAIVVSLV